MLISLACRSVTIAVLILTPPIFLHFGTRELLGSWLILVAIPVSLNLFDLGVPHIAGSYMAISYAKGDHRHYASLFWTALSYALCSLPIIVSIIYILRDLLVRITVQSFDPVVLSITIGLMVVQAQLQAITLNAVRARGQVSVSQMIDAGGRLFELGVVTIALARGSNLLGCIVAAMLVRLAALGFAAAVLAVGDRPGHLRQSGPSRQTFGKLLVPSTTYALNGAGQLAYIQAPILLLGSAVGAGASAAYSSMRTLSRMGAQIFMPLLDPLRPQLSAAYAVADQSKLRLLFGRALQSVVWSSIGLALILIVFGRFVFTHWTLGKIPFDPPLFWMLLASSIFYSISQVQMLFLASLARHQVLSSLSFGLIALAIAAAWLIGSNARIISGSLLVADAAIALIGGVIVRRVAPEATEGAILAALKPPLWLARELGAAVQLGLARLAVR